MLDPACNSFGRVSKASGTSVAALLVLILLAGCAAPKIDISRPPNSRSLEEIQWGFEQGKAKFMAVHLAYKAQFPDTPTRKIHLTITVEPDGRMSECVPGSLNIAPKGLTRVVAEQAMQLNFGAREVPSFHYENYPVVFLYEEPSSSAEEWTP